MADRPSPLHVRRLMAARAARLSERTAGLAQAVRRHRSPAPATEAAPTLEDRRHAAEQALIAADDSLLTSLEELGALTEPRPVGAPVLDSETAAPFAAAVAASRTDVDTAFALRQQALAEQDHPGEARLLEQVIALCRAAGRRLDAQVRPFDTVRGLDRSAATVLGVLAEEVQGLQDRLPACTDQAEQLVARYPRVALATTLANLDQATERVRFADESLRVARELLRAGDQRGVVARVRAVEAAVRQAGLLLDDLNLRPGELARAADSLPILMEQTRRDLAAAENGEVEVSQSAGPVRTFAEATANWAASAIDTGGLDPIALRRALLDSDAALVGAFAPALDEQAARDRADRLTDPTSDSANASLREAQTVISTRRAVIGADARLRLAQAQRTLQTAAVAADNPVRRLDHLLGADQLADQALTLAQRDEVQAIDQRNSLGAPPGENAAVVTGGILVPTRPSAEEEPAARGTQVGAVSFGGAATRARRAGAGRF